MGNDVKSTLFVVSKSFSDSILFHASMLHWTTFYWKFAIRLSKKVIKLFVNIVKKFSFTSADKKWIANVFFFFLLWKVLLLFPNTCPIVILSTQCAWLTSRAENKRWVALVRKTSTVNSILDVNRKQCEGSRTDFWSNVSLSKCLIPATKIHFERNF